MDLRPDSVFVQGGFGPHHVRSVGAGLAWDWDWSAQWRSLRLAAQTELFANHWQADDFSGGHQGFRQAGLLPLLRVQPDAGRSPWFLEFGIGVSWLDRLYVTPSQGMSKQFNFYDVLGAGYQFGPDRRHELGLRYTHVSNGGLKDPNPGEDFLMLRYARRF